MEHSRRLACMQHCDHPIAIYMPFVVGLCYYCARNYSLAGVIMDIASIQPSRLFRTAQPHSIHTPENPTATAPIH